MLSEIRLLIVASDPLARSGLAVLLNDRPGISVLGQADSREAVTALTVYEPDLLVWDLGWESTAVTDLAELSAALPVVALVADEAAVMAAWTAGAKGILLREAPAATMVAAVAAVEQGLTVMDAAVHDMLAVLPNYLPAYLAEPLTPRETEVLHLLAEGLTNKAIGQRLAISDHTVKFHVNAIMEKLDAQSRTEAVVQATRLGLILL